MWPSCCWCGCVVRDKLLSMNIPTPDGGLLALSVRIVATDTQEAVAICRRCAANVLSFLAQSNREHAE